MLFSKWKVKYIARIIVIFSLGSIPTNFKSSRKSRLRSALASGFDFNEFCKHKLLHFSLWMFPRPFTLLVHDEDKVRQRKKKITNYCCRVTDEHAAACLLLSYWRNIHPNTINGGIMHANSQVI